MARGSLVGIRVCLSASLPSGIAQATVSLVTTFVRQLARAVFREGGLLVHGSHPAIAEMLESLALEAPFGGGLHDRLTLVRAAKYCTEQWASEIEAHSLFARVQQVPSRVVNGQEVGDLVPMRDWMADRCDVVVALGGDGWDSDKERAGIPIEIEAFLSRGKPAFVITAFGLAAGGYSEADPTLLGRLKNGLDSDANRKLGEQPSDITKIPAAVESIVKQIGLLPLGRPQRPAAAPAEPEALGTMAEAMNAKQQIESPAPRDTFRILCLDGGGIRGAFTAAVLAQWEAMLPDGSDRPSLVDHFDLVAGTSTGSILATGLAMGLAPYQLVELYRKYATKIFPPTSGLKIFFTRKFAAEPLKTALAAYLGKKALREARRPLVIPSVSAGTGAAVVITTPHSADRTGWRSTQAIEAIMASAAAPAFFDAATVSGPIATAKFLDGGLWANNPAMPAIIESISHLGASVERLDVLSVGTMTTECDFSESLDGGYRQWVMRISDLFFAAQETAAAELAEMLVGATRWMRVNDFTTTLAELDEANAVDALVARGAESGKRNFKNVRGRFLDGSVAPPWKSY